jgi:hypothetical protein
VLAIFMFALVAADLLALFMSAGSLALLCFGKFRVCGAAVLRGRLGGAIGASAPFLPRALRQPRREPIFRVGSGSWVWDLRGLRRCRTILISHDAFAGALGRQSLSWRGTRLTFVPSERLALLPAHGDKTYRGSRCRRP